MPEMALHPVEVYRTPMGVMQGIQSRCYANAIPHSTLSHGISSHNESDLRIVFTALFLEEAEQFPVLYFARDYAQ